MNIFQNSTKSVPDNDPQIVRVDMSKSDIGGRKSHLPGQEKSAAMSIQHVSSSGGSK